MKTIKQIAKNILPKSFKSWYYKIKARRYGQLLAKERNVNSKKNVREIFTEIYRHNKWGGEQGDFHSGSGSDSRLTRSYCDAIRQFIQTHSIQSVIDLGCGDFRVGANLQVSGVQYLGVDIVEDLIRRNNLEFASASTRFTCLDIIDDDLPEADLCLVRQVLQHLSNDQISKILNKFSKYRYVLITEHYPANNVSVIPNIDKPHGADTRIYDNSAVYLDMPPFNLRHLSLFLEVEEITWLVREGETIRTYLLINE
jgi:SAM-dependent methyltransferase